MTVPETPHYNIGIGQMIVVGGASQHNLDRACEMIKEASGRVA